MTEQAKKFWTWCYMIAAITMIGFVMTGCVEVGGGGSTSASVDADTTSTSDQPAAE